MSFHSHNLGLTSGCSLQRMYNTLATAGPSQPRYTGIETWGGVCSSAGSLDATRFGSVGNFDLVKLTLTN